MLTRARDGHICHVWRCAKCLVEALAYPGRQIVRTGVASLHSQRLQRIPRRTAVIANSTRAITFIAKPLNVLEHTSRIGGVEVIHEVSALADALVTCQCTQAERCEAKVNSNAVHAL